MSVSNTYQVKVDIKKKPTTKAPEVIANDKVVFEVEVFDNGTLFPLDQNYIYYLVSKSYKKDANAVIRQGTLTNGKIVFTLGSSEFEHIGKVEATVQIFDSTNKRVSTAYFDYKVVKDNSFEGELPNDEKNLVIVNESVLNDINEVLADTVNDLDGRGISASKFEVDITGVTDSSEALQQLIDYANSSGIKKILLPKGIIAIGTKINSFQGITFEGNDTVIKGINGISKFMDAQSQNTFKNITFDTFEFVIQATNKQNVNFDKCKFLNISKVAIYYYGATDSIVSNCYFNNISKDSINIDNDSDNILITQNVFGNPLEFGGYSVEQTTAHVYVLNGNDIKVIDNKVFNNGGQGIIFGYNSTTSKGTTNSKAIGNTCEGNGQEGITSFGGSATLKASYGNIIANNICRKNRYHQIEIWNSDRCVVQGNIVDEFNTYGNMGAITLFGTNNTSCSSNVILNASNNGIAILAGSSKTIVTSNVIKGTNGKNSDNSTNGHGVLLDSNGAGIPNKISIISNIIESTNEIFTNEANKSGIYSTSQTQQLNEISSNNAFGYRHIVHVFSKATAKGFSYEKPTDVVNYKDGDYVLKIVPVESGSAGEKYIVAGWRLVSGVWLDDRQATGN